MRAIDYPVAADNDYAIWNTFANRYWPALYFADQDGVIRDQHFGEGRLEQSERVIQRLLGVGARSSCRSEALGVEAQADWDHLQDPGDLGLRARRGRAPPPCGAPSAWASTAGPSPGEWTIEPEKVVFDRGRWEHHITASTRATRISCCHEERGRRSPSACSSTVSLRAPPRGEDLDEDGSGLIDDGRLYQLVRQDDAVRERTLQITFLEPGAEAYVFTFG